MKGGEQLRKLLPFDIIPMSWTVVCLSLLHNYCGSGGRDKPFGSAKVVTLDPAGARGVSAG